MVGDYNKMWGNYDKILNVMNDRKYLDEIQCQPLDIIKAVSMAINEVINLEKEILQEFNNGLSFESLADKYCGMNFDGELFDVNYCSINATIMLDENAKPFVNLKSVGIYPDNISQNCSQDVWGQEMLDLDLSQTIDLNKIKDIYLMENKDKIICVDYSVDNDLSKYVDSLLFESGTQIAYANFQKGKNKVYVSLEVRGQINIDYKGEIYTNPEEYPDELINLIKSGKIYFDDNVYMNLNNWFEYIYTENNICSDGFVCEVDVSELSPYEIVNNLTEVASICFAHIEKEQSQDEPDICDD